RSWQSLPGMGWIIKSWFYLAVTTRRARHHISTWMGGNWRHSCGRRFEDSNHKGHEGNHFQLSVRVFYVVSKRLELAHGIARAGGDGIPARRVSDQYESRAP